MSRRQYPHGVREHHILYTEATQNSQEATAKLRRNQWLKVPLYDVVHDKIHEELPSMPVLDHRSAPLVEREFQPTPGNYFRTVDNLLFAMEAVKHLPGVNHYQQEYISFVMNAVDLQRPYVQEGIYRGTRQ